MRGLPPQHLMVCSPSHPVLRGQDLAGKGGVDRSLCKGHSRSVAQLPVCLGHSQPVFCRDSEEESKQGDFRMVFACFLLCFPLEEEAAATGPLNVGLEGSGTGSWRGEWLM